MCRTTGTRQSQKLPAQAIGGATASAPSPGGGRVRTVHLLWSLALGTAVYVAWLTDWPRLVQSVVSGPGRTSRIILLLFAIFNWKSVPFAWTSRVFYTILYNYYWRDPPSLTPGDLFKPTVLSTHAPTLEMDYNLHKSNSTYFADLDIARIHLVSFLCRPGLRKLTRNRDSRLVLDTARDKPAEGSVSIILGSIQCSFTREIPIYRGYELQSRVLCWDRKWMYVLTHFVSKAAARPAERQGHTGAVASSKRIIYATALSKYVFKLGRLTVHPAVILAESGVLPPRPGGWTSGAKQVGDEAAASAAVAEIDLSNDQGEWDWRRVEAQRRKGIEMAANLEALDGLQGLFDGGADGFLDAS